MITVDNLKNILAYYNKEKSIYTIRATRALGVMEGLLLAYGKINPGEDFQYKQIEIFEYGWFGNKKKITRKQTYSELITELFENLIKTFNNEPTT